MAGKTPNIKSPNIATFLVALGLVLQAVVEGGLAFFFWHGGIPQFAGERAISASEIATDYSVVAVGLLALAILTFIVFCFWLWRSVDNVDEVGAHISYSRGGVIGWWFVPFANLWKPFDMMCELYSASRDPHQWTENRWPTLVILWWALQIGAGILAAVVRFGNMGGGVDMNLPSGWMYAAGAIRLALLLVIVLRINSFQKRLQFRPGVERLF